MQHSLRHRFQGALLGAALGETLGINSSEKLTAKSPLAWLTMQHWGFSIPVSSQLRWSEIAVQQCECFIQGTFQEKQGIPASVLSPASGQPDSLAGLAIATLPIALFYHEDWHQLRDRLEQAVATWPIAVPIASILTIAYTISLALQERLHLATLIPRLITDLELHDCDPQLMQQLNQVQVWVQQGWNAARVKSLMQQPNRFHASPSASLSDPTAVVVALYGFLSTPTNFQLSLLRTAQLFHQPHVSCAIVSALSGAYNSIAGIPLAWRRAFNSTTQFPRLKPLSLDPASPSAELLQQADLLWATWSGVDNPVQWLEQLPQATIASPYLIRSEYGMKGR